MSKTHRNGLQVFDQRVGGGDVKDLVGDGLTSYGVKQLVQKIKAAAREFASDDPEFLGMIEKALEDEAKMWREGLPKDKTDLEVGIARRKRSRWREMTTHPFIW